MPKRTALANATKKPVDPEAWVSEPSKKPKAVAKVAKVERPARLVVELPPTCIANSRENAVSRDGRSKAWFKTS